MWIDNLKFATVCKISSKLSFLVVLLFAGNVLYFSYVMQSNYAGTGVAIH